MAPLTLYFLQNSRSIRTAWLLEELDLDYEVQFFDREPNNDTPSTFRKDVAVGRAPALKDRGVVLVESGAIAEYLCEAYDKGGQLMPRDLVKRAELRKWMYASEGTFLMHALAIAYGSGVAPESTEKLQTGLSEKVHRDFDWLDETLIENGTKFLLGDSPTAADTMMHFSVAFILKRGLGIQGRRWLAVEKWQRACEDREAYQRAVYKTEHVLD